MTATFVRLNEADDPNGPAYALVDDQGQVAALVVRQTYMTLWGRSSGFSHGWVGVTPSGLAQTDSYRTRREAVRAVMLGKHLRLYGAGQVPSALTHRAWTREGRKLLPKAAR